MRTFVIQEHDAVKAGLHWDIRFEDDAPGYKVLRSWVIPKHRMPGADEKLLCIPVADHPWGYRDFEGTLEGYGEGTVKLVFCGLVEVETFTDTKVKFTYNGLNYLMFYVPGMKKWLIKRT